MAEPRPGLKFFSLDEANEMLPKVRTQIKLLREVRKRIVSKQALVDIEELTAPSGGRVDRQRQDQLLGEIEQDVHSFHKTLEAFQGMGCELKTAAPLERYETTGFPAIEGSGLAAAGCAGTSPGGGAREEAGVGPVAQAERTATLGPVRPSSIAALLEAMFAMILGTARALPWVGPLAACVAN